jgi:hypothetical protein
METNEKVLIEMVLNLALVTEKLLDDHIRLAQSMTAHFDPELSGMLPTIRVLRHRVQEYLKPLNRS